MSCCWRRRWRWVCWYLHCCSKLWIHWWRGIAWIQELYIRYGFTSYHVNRSAVVKSPREHALVHQRLIGHCRVRLVSERRYSRLRVFWSSVRHCAIQIHVMRRWEKTSHGHTHQTTVSPLWALNGLRKIAQCTGERRVGTCTLLASLATHRARRGGVRWTMCRRKILGSELLADEVLNGGFGSVPLGIGPASMENTSTGTKNLE